MPDTRRCPAPVPVRTPSAARSAAGFVDWRAARRAARLAARRATTCTALIAAILTAGWASGASAQTWPDRPVKLVVPFAPGGALDIVARVVAERMQAAIGQPMVVENRVGASGAIGAELVAKAKPDGYTLLQGSLSTHGTSSAVARTLPYDPVKDFQPVVLLVRFPYVLVAAPDLPAKTAGELVALAKSRPGKLNYASYGAGSANHLPMELFKALTGIDIVHVPYKGAAPAVAAIAAGEVHVMFDSPGPSLPLIRAGRVKAIGVASIGRSALLPDVPPIAESGVSTFEAGSFIGIFAPAGTPAETVATLQRAANRVVWQPDVRDRLAEMGYESVGATGEVLGATVVREVARWQRLVREQRLTFE